MAPISVNPSRQQEWLTSIERAVKEHVRVWRVKEELWHSNKDARLTIAHSTRRGEVHTLHTYTIRLQPQNQPAPGQDAPSQQQDCLGVSCSCDSYTFRQYCKHAARLALTLSKKGQQIRLQ